MSDVSILRWEGCYDSSWKGLITDASFAHPAKFSRGLIERIYDHCLAQGYLRRGDIVADVFGGIGTGGIVAAYRGLNWIGCELEPKFVALAQENFKLHRHGWAAVRGGSATIIQGDSRKFDKHVAAVLSSPPYSDSIHNGNGIDQSKLTGNTSGKNTQALAEGYGESAGQIGSLKSGAVDSVIKKDLQSITELPNLSHGKNGSDKSTSDGKVEVSGTGNPMVVFGSEMEHESNRSEIRSDDCGDGQMDGTVRDSIPRKGKEGTGASGIQGRQMEPRLSKTDSEGRMLDVSVKGNSGSSPQERRSFRQSCGESGNPLQFVSHEDNKKEMVGREEIGTSVTEEQRNCGMGSEAGLSAIVSSPPFTQGYQGGGGINKNGYTARPDLGTDWVGQRSYQGRGAERTDGNIEKLKEGSVQAIVSSPPYSDIAAGAGGLNTKPAKHPGQQSGRKAESASQDTDQRYGTSAGQISQLRGGSMDACVSSPPFESSSHVNNTMMGQQPGKGIHSEVAAVRAKKDYIDPDSEGQIGKESGETYWQAVDAVYRSAFRCIRPGGVIVLVVKDYCAKGKRVRLCDDTMRLLEHIGFVPLERIHAMLVTETVENGLFGEERTKRQRKSFFRRLYEKDIPEGDERRIDHEEVLVARRP